MSPDVNDPGFRAVTFDELVAAYTEAAEGLIEGGADLLLIETIFDTLNAKAAIFAIEGVFERLGERLPVMISGTITDQSGRTLSGQTTEAFWNSMAHARPLSIGLNCALGAKDLRPYVQELSRIAPVFVSTHPNAGLPNEFGGYDEAPGVHGGDAGRVRPGRAAQLRGRLLRHHAGAHPRHRGGGAGRPAAGAADACRRACGSAGSSRSPAAPRPASSTSASAPTSPARRSSRS